MDMNVLQSIIDASIARGFEKYNSINGRHINDLVKLLNERQDVFDTRLKVHEISYKKHLEEHKKDTLQEVLKIGGYVFLIILGAITLANKLIP